MILPRQGEVSPKVTEGEDTEQRLACASPSVRLTPATSPLRGRIVRWWRSESFQSLHPGEGRGPIGKVAITTCRHPLATSPNWAPAFAGVVA